MVGQLFSHSAINSKNRVFLALCAFLFWASDGISADFIGPVTHMVDGDTFDMRMPGETIRIRLCGIDTPERGKPRFKEAKNALASQIDGRTIRCVPVGEGTVCDGRSNKKSWDRYVAQCFMGTNDIALPMIRSGLACDYTKHSGGHYRRIAGGKPCPNS